MTATERPFDVDVPAIERALEAGPAMVQLEAPLEADVDPLAAYAALAEATPGSSATHRFLLESAVKAPSSDPGGAYSAGDTEGQSARFSFIGYAPDGRLTVSAGDAQYEPFDAPPIGDPLPRPAPDTEGTLDHLRSGLPDAPVLNRNGSDRHRLEGGLVGFIAYEAVYDLWDGEPRPSRPATTVPDAQFVRTTRTVVIDHLEGAVTLVLTPYLEADTDPAAVFDAATDEVDRIEAILADPPETRIGPFEVDGVDAGDRAAYEGMVETVGERIRAGEVYQTVVARSRELTGRFDPLRLYVSLRERNPSPYMYHLEFDDFAVVGASPEALVSVTDDGDRQRAVVNPIAGTAPRGGSPTAGAPDPVEDRRLAGELLADPKERAEHTMLVDLARNDLRRVCDGGTVEVTEFMAVRKYSHVQHIESEVAGTLDAAADALDALGAVFPAGTLTGAPKRRSMELIRTLEDGARGVYGGGVGYVTFSGEADFAIAIRTATVAAGDPDRLVARAGAGVVAASDPAAEYEETEAKLGGIVGAIDHLLAADTREVALDG